MTPRWSMSHSASLARGKVRILLAALLLDAAFSALALLACPATALGVSGTVYSCTVVPAYEHPVTGVIEDAGGSSGKATGQGMVESCINTAGMMEITDDDLYFLTIRLSMIDQTGNYSFQAQEWGADSWSDAASGVTQQGSDKLGTTNDVCIQLPARQSVVRVSFYVGQMGRDVVCYCYPTDLAAGAPDGFVATMVTEVSQNGASAGASTGSSTSSGSSSDSSQESSSGTSISSSSSSSTEAADIEGAGLSEAQGLDLSTTPDGEATQTDDSSGADSGSGWLSRADTVQIAGVIVGSIVVSGMVLMAIASLIVYLFRRNWNRIGGSDPDDYGQEYPDELR